MHRPRRSFCCYPQSLHRRRPRNAATPHSAPPTVLPRRSDAARARRTARRAPAPRAHSRESGNPVWVPAFAGTSGKIATAFCSVPELLEHDPEKWKLRRRQFRQPRHAGQAAGRAALGAARRRRAGSPRCSRTPCLRPIARLAASLALAIRRLSGLAIRDDVGHGTLLRRWPSTATGRSRKRASSAITVNTHALIQARRDVPRSGAGDRRRGNVSVRCTNSSCRQRCSPKPKAPSEISPAQSFRATTIS